MSQRNRVSQKDCRRPSASTTTREGGNHDQSRPYLHIITRRAAACQALCDELAEKSADEKPVSQGWYRLRDILPAVLQAMQGLALDDEDDEGEAGL